jgi:hypothetical protein
VEDPLKCPLDVGHFADAGHGLEVLLDAGDSRHSAPKQSIQPKPVPSVDLFDVKPDVSAKPVPVKNFLTPFQRFQVSRSQGLAARLTALVYPKG